MAPEPNKLEACVKELTRLVESFTDQQPANKQSLQQLADDDLSVFCIAGIRVLAAVRVSPGVRYLVQLLTKARTLTAGLLDPKTSNLPEALAACRTAVEAGAQLQSALEIALTQALQASTSTRNSSRILRILDLMSATGAQTSWNSFQLELMAYPDKVVRSKAALLIGKNVRNIAWIGRRLMDRDPRVQASAVEALWGNPDPEAKALLGVALKSKNNRVAANAALGLYRISDERAVTALMEMIRHPDPAFRLSALWAIGQTEDPRFLPALREQFPSAEGKTKLAIAGALSHILRRERERVQTSPIELHGGRTWVDPDGKRHLTFALSGATGTELGGLTSTAFAVWENQQLIGNCDVQASSSPAVMIAGFVTPHFPGSVPFDEAVRDGLSRCLAIKRSGDLWRIDRYPVESISGDPENADQAVLPYDEATVTPDVKMRHGCIAEPNLLAKLIPLITPKPHLAAGFLNAVERQGHALGKHSGKRHMFLLLAEKDHELTTEPVLARLRAVADNHSLVFHGLCQTDPASWDAFRDFCLSMPEGTFEEAPAEAMAEKLALSYALLLNHYELSYGLPGVDRGPVTVKVTTANAIGQAVFSLAAPPVPEAPLPVAAPERAAEPDAEPAAESVEEPVEAATP